ncbi:creatininase family protein [Kaistia dalseonensis]|uniref:Creatinine amidohydrolase n=1 Tax=Kaistia dalseonensis TaxID=410840 RepID=A0ABU0H4A3_9HYPH|nr:creatininase family protein [Kaistia dalseonensis]MCX5494536.1 creatininase family protein [Kaistia dalseonensis]MDQ0437115.1 creatinine amidohydrolase [Kaistia dalseonensis]
MLPSRYWWDLTTAEFSKLDMSKVVALQPVGAIEQHGPHLPVRVDAAINAGIVQRAIDQMPDDLQVLVLPAMPIGKSNEHLAFPGTLSFSYETLARLWFEIGESVNRAGCRKIVFFNSHGGQPQVMDIVCRELRVKLDMFAVASTWFGMTDLTDLFSEAEHRHGIHGGEIETSLMLDLHPDLVKMDLAENFVPLSVALEKTNEVLIPYGKVDYGWQAQDVQPTGAMGNASAADPARGKIAVDRAAALLVKLLTEVAAFPLSHITQKTAYSAD